MTLGFFILLFDGAFIHFWSAIIEIKIFFELTDVHYFLPLFVFTNNFYFDLRSVDIHSISWSLFSAFLLAVCFFVHFLLQLSPFAVLLIKILDSTLNYLNCIFGFDFCEIVLA